MAYRDRATRMMKSRSKVTDPVTVSDLSKIQRTEQIEGRGLGGRGLGNLTVWIRIGKTCIFGKLLKSLFEIRGIVLRTPRTCRLGTVRESRKIV